MLLPILGSHSPTVGSAAPQPVAWNPTQVHVAASLHFCTWIRLAMALLVSHYLLRLASSANKERCNARGGDRLATMSACHYCNLHVGTRSRHALEIASVHSQALRSYESMYPRKLKTLKGDLTPPLVISISSATTNASDAEYNPTTSKGCQLYTTRRLFYLQDSGSQATCRHS